MQVAKSDWGSAWGSAAWEGIDRELERLASLSRERHFTVIMMCFPVVFQVYAEDAEDTPQRKLETLSSKYGFAYLDLLPVLRENRAQDLFYDHCHLKKTGHDIVGEFLADSIFEAALGKNRIIRE